MHPVWLGLSLVLADSVGGGTASAQTEPAGGSVLIKLSEAATTDAGRTQLATTLAADVPFALWKTVRVLPGEGLQAIVDRIYDVYSIASGRKNEEPLPRTAATLTRIIREYNGLPDDKLQAGQILKVPPMLVRTRNGEAPAGTVRVFDPYSMSYTVRNAVGSVATITTGDRANNARELGAARIAAGTVLAVSAAGAEALAPVSDAAQRTRYATIKLLQTRPCERAEPRIDESPYTAPAKNRVASVLPSIKADRNGRRLAILDFDFDRRFHGNRVRSAADWLLLKLGALDLASRVDNVELNKGVSRVALADMLGAYDAWLANGGFDADFVLAEPSVWLIRSQGTAPGSTIYTMPTSMVSAAVWFYLNRGAVVSLSWIIESNADAQPVKLNDVLDSGGSFVVSAAGNDPEEVRADLFPQQGASIAQEFVNVTHSAQDGTLIGAGNGVRRPGKVDLMTIGCGIAHGSLTETDSGSSYATPVVATAAWLKMLVDGTRARDMRKALVRASLLVPPGDSRRVISQGVFDPGRLLYSPPIHALDRLRKTLISLNSLELDAGRCGSFRPIPANRGSQDVIVYARDGKHYLLWRHDDTALSPSPPGVRVEAPCELAGLKLTADGPAGPLTAESPGEFVQKIGHLTF